MNNQPWHVLSNAAHFANLPKRFQQPFEVARQVLYKFWQLADVGVSQQIEHLIGLST